MGIRESYCSLGPIEGACTLVPLCRKPTSECRCALLAVPISSHPEGFRVSAPVAWQAQFAHTLNLFP